MLELDKVRALIVNQNGIIATSQVEDAGIPRAILGKLVESGELQRVTHGIYCDNNLLEDELAILQLRTHKMIYSHDTALFLHNLTDRSPLQWTVTVPSGYNASTLKRRNCIIHYVKAELFQLGIEQMLSPGGHQVRAYGIERTVVDMVRNRNQCEIEILTQALRKYVARKDKNISNLMQMAKQFQVERLTRQYMEVLL